MSELIITGGKRLEGSLRVGGAKNAALPILAATLLCENEVTLVDCPALRDVENMLEILRVLGCSAERQGDAVNINTGGADSYVMPHELSKELRSSIFMLGPVLARFGRAHFAYPGGCEIGNRPIDLHLHGLSSLNVTIREEHGCIICDGRMLTGATVHLDYPSVGATENIMMAAVAAKGDTVIHNAAREPEIVDLQNFLCALGHSVSGAGTSDIYVRGGTKGHGCVYRIMPDRIVAGTLMCAAAITGGDVALSNVMPQALGSVMSKLREAGCRISGNGSELRIRGPERPSEIKLIETLPHPGFPTDMQPQMFALCAVADGTSIIVENVFDNRFKHGPELSRMGATMTLKDRTAIIRGVPALTGAHVHAKDLRGGAALALAGLRAEGETVIRNAELIDRGYERYESMLSALGADARMERV